MILWELEKFIFIGNFSYKDFLKFKRNFKKESFTSFFFSEILDFK